MKKFTLLTEVIKQSSAYECHNINLRAESNFIEVWSEDLTDCFFSTDLIAMVENMEYSNYLYYDEDRKKVVLHIH